LIAVAAVLISAVLLTTVASNHTKKTIMQELKVVKDKAVTAFKNATSDGRKLLNDLFGKEVFSSDPKEYVKTFGDVCEEAGVVADSYRILPSMDVFTRLKLQIQRWQLIMQVFNGEWEAKVGDTSQYKYSPYFKVIPDSTATGGFRLAFCVYVFDFDYSYLGVRLYFKDSPTATYVGQTFIAEAESLVRIQQELFLTKSIN
jgi:hypothetical protein